MTRRLLVALGALLLALFFVPQLPPVRDALLRWGVGFAARQGYTVTYRESAGNLLYNLKLTGLNVTGPGVDVAVDTLGVGYTLPALVTGTLPLRAEVSGVRGSLDLGTLPVAAPAAPGEPQAAPRRARIRPVLRHAELSDVALDVRGAPFDVPDAKLTSLEVRQDGDTLAFDAALTVQDAVAEVSGRVMLAPFSLNATVTRADVALAKPFFDGAESGTLSGTVQADGGGVEADLELHNGQVDLVGLKLESVSGPVRVRGDTLTADLTGRALGGPLAGAATVDFGARHWEADVTGDAGLAEALGWLGEGRISPAAVRALEPSGRANVSLNVGGWQDFTLSGTAAGRGSLLGEPLTDLGVDFGFKTDVGTTVTADARLGGAPLSVALTPRGQGFTLEADGANLPLRGLEGDVALDLEQQESALTGSADLNVTGTALGRAVRGRARATTDGEAWRVSLRGRDALGARLAGALELREGLVDGAVRVTGLEFPGLEEPVSVTARADGPLTELPVRVRVAGPEGVRVAAGGVQAEADFSGAATATLEGGTLTGVRGDFGPLSVSGTLEDLRYALAPTALSGRASGRVALREGRLTREDGRLETTARLTATDLRGAGVTLPDLDADVSLTRGDTLTAAVTDPDAGVEVRLQGGALRGTLSGAQVGALGDTFAVTGDMSGRLADLTDTLALDLRARTPGSVPGTTLRAVGDARRTRLSLESDAGATLAGRTLGGALELSGDASLTGRSAALSGTLGGVGVEVAATPDAAGRVRTRAGLSAGGDTFRASFRSLERWETDGTLPLGELGDALGLPLSGSVRTTLARQGSRFSGQAEGRGQVFGLPFRVDAAGQGGALTLDATASLLGQPLTLSGRALPDTDATLQLGPYGQVRVSGTYPALNVTGSGRVPGSDRAGLSVPAQPWSLSGDLGAGRAGLRVGDSSVRAARGPNGWRLTARLEQRAAWRGTPLALAATVTRTPQSSAGRVEGTLTLGGSPLTLAGTLRDLNVNGTLPAGALQPGLLGRVGVEVNADAFARTYDAALRWRRPHGTQALRLTAEGQRGEATATAEADGLSARFSTASGEPTWRLEATRFALSSLPVRSLQGLDARLGGTLSAQNGYDGQLRLTSDVGTAQLTGTGPGLTLTATAEHGGLEAEVSGTLLPDLELSLRASAGDAMSLTGSLTGPPTRPQLRATLRTAAQNLGGGQLRVPARRLELRASLGGGLSAALSGRGTDVRLREGRWGGWLALAFTLRGEPHRLAGTVEGTLAAPTLAADLSGPVVRGPLTLSRSGLEGDLAVKPGLAAVPDAEVRIGLSATPDLRWQIEVGGTATLPYRALPATLRGRVQGDGARYTGTGTVSVAGEAVPVTLSGEAAHVQARAALEGVRLDPFVPARGTVSGDVRVATNGALRFFANLSAAGTTAGRPFDLTLSADREGLDLSGSAAGASVTLTGPLPLRTLELNVASSEQPLELSASLGLGEARTLQGSGAWRGEALRVTGAYAPDTGDGTLELTLADAALTATLQTTGAGRRLTGSLAAPTGLLNVETPFSLDAVVTQTDETLALTNLDARFGAATLSAAGTVQPQADVRGTLVVPAAGEPIALRLTALETGYLAALRQGTLELRGVLKPTFVPERARLVGTLSCPDLGLESDLVWQEGAGFSGRADLGLSRGEVAATLALVGETGLRVRGGARVQDVPVAALSASLSEQPWRDRRLEGTLRLDAPVHDLVPAWPGDPLRLRGRLGISGDLTAPRLAGPLALRGAIVAAGRIQADREGARVSLRGPGLSAVGSVGASGYRSTLSLDGLDLSGVLPQPVASNQAASGSRTPTLSGAVRATRSWGSPPQAQADLRLVSGGSAVRARARLAEAFSGALELDVYLPDFSPELRGQVSGPLRITAQGPLSGALTVRNLGPAAADWGLGGTLELSGNLEGPVVGAALAGTGSADGTLRAEVAPRDGRLELTSDLALLGAETDLTLTRTRRGVSGGGTLRYGDFGARLRTEEGRVVMAGTARLRGWRGLYGRERFSLQGPLGSLNPQLSGRLVLRGPADFGALEGSLTGAAFGPVGFDEVALEARSRQLILRGERLEADVKLSPDLPWTLTRLDPALPGGVGVTASGAGTRTHGDLTGTLRAASLTLPVTARYTPQALALRASGSLPIGALDLRARYQAGSWQGRLNVTEAGRRVVESTLSGPLAAPTLAGSIDLARGENTVQGRFSVGRDAARLEARLGSPQLSTPLTVSGAGWPLDLTLATPESAVQLSLRGGRLEPSGALELGVGPTEMVLRADGGRLRLSARVPAAPGLALHTTLPRELSEYVGLLDGVRFTGAGRTRGTLTVQARPTPRFTAAGLAWRAPAGTLSLTGRGGLGGRGAASGVHMSDVRGRVEGRWRGAEEAALPWLRNADVPFTAQADGGQFSLRSVSDLGRAAARFDAAAGRLTLTSDLTLGRGRVAADVRYTRADGPTGTVRLESVPIFTFGKSVATLGSRLTLTPRGVSGRGALNLAGGQADLSGEAGWARILPAPLRRFTPEGGDALSAEVRLERFELGGVPQVAAHLPYLSAPVSGVATLTGAQLVGQLVAPELRVLETPLPTQVEFNGTLRALEARASVADSRLSVRYTREPRATVAGLVTLEGFALQTLAEAVVGASQVEATVTGAARFEIPLSAPRASYVRLATERLTLENSGTEGDSNTQGEVALRFEDGSLYVERAEFRGDGFWRASGILTPEELDFTLQAQNADFTPLLSLVPRLAAFDVGAEGSLNVQASGSLSAPDIALISPRLEISVAGSRYRALDTQASLSGGAFGLRSDVVGVSPITGRLDLRGSGQVNLAPFVTSDLAFRFSGDATVPTVGRVEDLEGRIYPSSRGWQLDGGGTLGRPFTVSGDLAPLDLTLMGEGLNIQARRLFVASSTTDVTLNVRSDALDFVVSGDAFVQQAQLSLNRRGGASARDTASQDAAEDTEADDAAADDAAAENTDAEDAEARDPTAPGAEDSAVATIGSALRRTTNPVFERVRFEDVRLRAPQEVIFQEAFGNAELSLDLTLSGTAATPRLDGEARTLRGSIRFSGQDFTLTQAVATFDPSQGVYPTLEIEAVATFDKTRALGGSAQEAGSGGTSLRFVEPSDSSFFDVQLSLTGSFEESLGGRRALDLEPTLTSNALVQEGATGASRPLTEAELVALLTLGRLQLDAPLSADALIGGNSLAGTVAESALDTAVDLLVVSELQDALGEALGVDLLEIRTSALSTFLGADGGEQNFGVSVRVGGYLDENLFASVQVGRYDDPDQNYALSNEFLLRYTAAPLELNLAGGVNFLEQRAVTDFSLGLSYAVTPLISLDASLETTALGQDTSVGFGVSFTW